MRSFCFVVLAAASLLQPLYSQSGKIKKGEDWPTYNHDLAGTRYSPLTQISKDNVAKLRQAWSYRLRKEDGAAGAFGGTTPIVANGLMYLPAGGRIVALQPETGKEAWRFEIKQGAARRGVSYWPGDKDHPARIFFSTGRKIHALNAETGKLDPGFGKEGAIDLSVPYNSPPTIYKNVLVIGANIGESMQGEPGNSRAYDARTGAKLWEFNSVPGPGEPGHETWLNDGWKGRSGVNVWNFYMSVDEQRGILYMPLTSPSTVYWGGDRPGANLFGNSIVAVDALTGKLKWHFQTIHHDIWDYDLPPAPGLIEINKDGKKIPALAQIGKTALMFILNREDGTPIFGVEERPVPPGDVPGEWYSPTQPFPVKPPPLGRIGYKPEDLVTEADTNAEHARLCRELVEKHGGELYNDGTPFTNFPFREEGTKGRSAVQFPAGGGGPNWGGTAFDPQLGYIFVNSRVGGLLGWIERTKDGKIATHGAERSKAPFERASPDGLGPYHSFSVPMKDADGRSIGAWPCVKPPWGSLYAVNASTGDIAWQVPLGLTDALPEGKRNTGRSNLGGPIATAAGLLFIGAADDGRFRAFDSKSGKELWSTKLEYSAQAIPITYRGKDGKQYVAVIAASPRPGEPNAKNESLVAFALP
jgi:quinoprotein glucose dehydrogenase